MSVALIVIIAIVLVAVAALVFGSVMLFRSLRGAGTRRTIESLIGRKEAIVVSYRALWGVVERLSAASDEELDRFSSDPDDEERRIFQEIASQMRIMEDELKNTDVPRSLERVIITMEDTSRLIFEAAGSVDGAGETDALTAAGEIDFGAMAQAVERMESAVHETAQRHHVDESSVYGGGLYI